MEKINDLGKVNQNDQLWAFELDYTGLHNGNIAGTAWKSGRVENGYDGGIRRGYTYTYDVMNRLRKATYSGVGNEKYDEEITGYDLNGNILGLKRWGLVSAGNYGLVDDLTYQYQKDNLGDTHRSNRLYNVRDAVAVGSVAGDFQDRHKDYYLSPYDYEYDANGSLILDRNKGISLSYNHLGLTSKINFITTPENSIDYTYNSAGVKLAKQKGSKITEYLDGFVYENGELQFLPMPEGRIVFTTAEGFVPEYQYTDHLGNLRLAYRPVQSSFQTVTYGFEDTEKHETVFPTWKTSVSRDSQHKTEKTYSGKLSNKTLESEAISVSAGQSVSVRVKSTYDRLLEVQNIENRLIRGENWVSTPDQPVPPAFLDLGNLNVVLVTPAMLLQSGTTYLPEQLGNYTPPRINLAAVAGLLRDKAKAIFELDPSNYDGFNENNVPLAVTGMDLVFSKPQAYLKLQIFDANGVFLSEKKQLISESALNSWETLSLGASIPQNGKIKVFLVNETEQEAFFDELEIVISNKPTAKIVQENNYYPFGLNMRGLEKVGSPDDKFQYNAQTEKDEDIEMYETPFRGYQADICVFRQVDLLASEFPSITPYQFAFNNPIIFNDPTGLEPNNDFGKLINELWDRSEDNASTTWTNKGNGNFTVNSSKIVDNPDYEKGNGMLDKMVVTRTFDAKVNLGSSPNIEEANKKYNYKYNPSDPNTWATGRADTDFDGNLMLGTGLVGLGKALLSNGVKLGISALFGRGAKGSGDEILDYIRKNMGKFNDMGEGACGNIADDILENCATATQMNRYTKTGGGNLKYPHNRRTGSTVGSTAINGQDHLISADNLHWVVQGADGHIYDPFLRNIKMGLAEYETTLKKLNGSIETFESVK